MEKIIPPGLELELPTEEEWVLGSGKATERFGGEVINPSGDWTHWKMPDERQSQFMFESNNCTVYATLKAWMMLAKFHGFSDFLVDTSERYVGTHAGTTKSGNNPHRVAETVRTYCGMVSENSMPWWEEINTFEEYYDKNHANGLLPYGKKLIEAFEPGHEWVFPFGSTITPKEKHALLQEALKIGTVCVSVDGSYSKRGNIYTKPDGKTDTHWATLLRFDGKHPVIHDQYSPFEKTLDKLYDFNAAKLHFLKRKAPSTGTSLWSWIVNLFVSKFKR